MPQDQQKKIDTIYSCCYESEKTGVPCSHSTPPNNKMKHDKNCNWENAKCSYKETHEYCPHQEHLCDCGLERIEKMTGTSVGSNNPDGHTDTTPPNKNWREKVAMNIVHQIGDELGISVEKRQATNDKLIDFVMRLISQVEQEAKQEGRDGLLKELGLTGAWNLTEIKSIQEQSRSATLAEVKKIIDFMSVDIRNENGDEYVKKSSILSALEKKE